MNDPKERSGRGPTSTFLSLGALVVALVALISVLATGRAAPTPQAFLEASSSLDAGVARAAEEGKVVFAVATADWCPACQAYKRGALADPRVSAWIARNAVPVYIDVTDGPTETSERLHVNAIPASFVLDAHEHVLANREGAASPDRLLSWLQNATERASTPASAD